MLEEEPKKLPKPGDEPDSVEVLELEDGSVEDGSEDEDVPLLAPMFDSMNSAPSLMSDPLV